MADQDDPVAAFFKRHPPAQQDTAPTVGPSNSTETDPVAAFFARHPAQQDTPTMPTAQQPTQQADPVAAFFARHPASGGPVAQNDAPANVNGGQPGGVYTRADMQQDPGLLAALQRHYAAKGEDTSDPNALLDKYYSDMRWVDNNVVMAGAYLKDINNAKDAGDTQYLQDMATMRQHWDQKSNLFTENGGFGHLDSYKALGENLIKGLVDPTSLLYFVPGLAEGKIALSEGGKWAATEAINAAIGAGMSGITQSAEKDLDMRDHVSSMEMLADAGLAALPGTVLKAGGMGLDFAKFLMNKVPDGMHPSGWEMKLKSLEQAPDVAKNLWLEHSGTGASPWVIRANNDVEKVMQDADEKPLVFPSVNDAAGHINNEIAMKTPMDADEYAAAQKNPERAYSSITNPTGWHASLARFADPEEAREFLQDHGDTLGSSDIKDYNLFDKNMSTPNSWSNKIGTAWMLTLQRHVDKMIFPNMITATGRNRIEENLERMGKDAPDYDYTRALLSDDPAKLAINGQNANMIVAAWYGAKPMGLVTAEDGVSKRYDYIPNSKSLADIMGDVHAGMKTLGVDDPVVSRSKFWAYIAGKRILDIENPANKNMEPRSTGINLDLIHQFMGSLSPEETQVLESGRHDLRQFNEYYLNFLKDHGVIGAEQIANMLQRDDFIPIQRLYDDNAFYNVNKGMGSLTVRKAISDKPKIGNQSILDPAQAYAMHINAGIHSAVENRSNTQMYDWVRAAGGAFANKYVARMDNSAERRVLSLGNIKNALIKTFGEDVAGHINIDESNKAEVGIWVRRALLADDPSGKVDFILRNGKPEFYEIRNPLWFDYMKGAGFSAASSMTRAADNMDMINWTVKGWKGFNHWFARMWVLNPAWNTVVAFPADALNAFLLDKNAMSSFKSAVFDLPGINAAAALGRAMTNPDMILWHANGGGLSDIRSSLAGSDYKKVLLQLTHKLGVNEETMIGLGLDHDKSVWEHVGHVLTSPFEKWANVIESALRYNTYKNRLMGGATTSDAAMASSMATVDFRREGTSAVSMARQRALASFTRPMINGLYQSASNYLPRVLTQDFSKTAGDKAAAWAKLIAVTAVPTAVYELSQKDPYYENLSDDYKDRWWFIPLNGQDDGGKGLDGYLKIRKYPEQGWLSNFVRYYFQEMRRSEVGRNMFQAMSGHMIDQLKVGTRFDDPYGNLPAPVAAVAQVLLGKKDQRGVLPQSQDRFSPEVGGDIRQMSGLRFLDSPEAEQIMSSINQTLNTQFTPADIPILMNGVLSGMTQYMLQLTDFAYTTQKGVYQFDWRSLPWVHSIYDPKRPVRYTADDERFNQYSRYVPKILNDLNAAKSQGKIKATEFALKRLADEGIDPNDPQQYHKYLQASELLKTAQQIRQQQMHNILLQYNLHQQDMPKVDFENMIDKMFAEKNAAMRGVMAKIADTLRTKHDLELETDRAIDR